MGDVILHIKGTQSQGDEVAELNITTSGTVSCTGDELTISYEDTEVYDDEPVTTSLVVGGNTVSMIKTGAIDTHFVFEERKTYATKYHTPMGDLDLSLFPTLISADVTPEHGHIDLEYVISVAGTQLVNRLNVNYNGKQ